MAARSACGSCVYGPSLAMAIVTSASVAAAGHDSSPQAGPGPLEEIVVTGSRLRRPPDDTVAPVDVFRSADLERAGINTLSDFARYLTYNVGVPNPARTAGTRAAAASYFNLRGIGAQATLTLINGRRVAAYGAAESIGHTFVDIDAIPITVIDRIEVLKDGASAIYGSEAIAGVVNVILKDDFDGLTLSGGYSSTTRDDAQESSVDLTWGARRGRTRIASTVSYLEREPLLAIDREYLADADLRGVGGTNQRTGFSAPMSLFRHDVQRVQAAPSCPSADSKDPVAYVFPYPQPHPVFDSFCTFNTQRYVHAVPATRRLGLTGTLRHPLLERAEIFVDAFASRTRTQTQVAPAVTDKTPLGTRFPLVLADHPGNPFDSSAEINYRVVDAGPITFDTDALLWQLASGVSGTTGAWDWSAATLFSESDVDIAQRGLVDAIAFQEALLGRGGPDRTRYYDPFGPRPANPVEVIDALRIPVSRTSERTRERAIELGTGRSLFEPSTRPIVAALGYQYRDQRLTAAGDEFQQSGTALGAELLRPFAASRDIQSAWLEIALPLSGSVELQLAARHEDYSDFGSTTNPKIALRWQLPDGLALRGSWGTSFRAPTFTELFETPQVREEFLRDTARCAATGAVFDCVAGPHEVVAGGNPALEPEQGRSWYAGIGWSPTRASAVEFNLDFWRFEHSDRIIALDSQFILDELGTDPTLVVRSDPLPGDPPGTPGPIELVYAARINAERLRTQGIDFAARYRSPPTRLGSVSIAAGLTYLDEYSLTATADAGVTEQNLAGGAALFPLPRVRSNLTVSWARGAGQLSALLHYVGGYRSPLNRVVAGRETDERFDVAGLVTLDLQYEHTFAALRSGVLRIGCQNCTDEAPPVYNYTADGEALHDPRGAIVYLRWSQPF